ncbi:putative coiled-coil domain-containing protein 195 [Mergus octosetaceus]
MEGNTHLLQVIREMRSQIDELERENRALRGELRACGPSATAARAGGLASPMPRPDPAPGPAAAASEQAATTMTVRRYSTAAAAPAPPGTRPPRAGKSPADCFSSSSPSKMKLFQEHVRRCRGKVKAVSFLLPMDVSACAENQGSLKSPQNQDTHELTTITEKDM